MLELILGGMELYCYGSGST